MILEAKPRGNLSGDKAKKSGLIPAVFYGPKEDSTPVLISLAEFKKIWKASGESSILNLKVGDKDLETLIHAVDVHPLTGEPRHADFYVIEKGKKVSVKVPLEFIGVAPAVKELGGVLVKVMYELEIEAMPKDLPHSIDIDISSLVDFEKQITIGDLKLPNGVEAVGESDEIVVMVHEAKEEVIEETEAPDLSSIEVEKKGKEAVPEEGETSTE
jgi:large subunit ribosomal protein L25